MIKLYYINETTLLSYEVVNVELQESVQFKIAQALCYTHWCAHTQQEDELRQWHLKEVYLSLLSGSYNDVLKWWRDFTLSGVTSGLTSKTYCRRDKDGDKLQPWLYLSVSVSLKWFYSWHAWTEYKNSEHDGRPVQKVKSPCSSVIRYLSFSSPHEMGTLTSRKPVISSNAVYHAQVKKNSKSPTPLHFYRIKLPSLICWYSVGLQFRST